MTVDRKLLATLRGPLLLTLTMMAVGIALAWLAGDELRAARATRAAAEQQHVELTARLSRSITGESEARERLARFREMQSRGLIGDERRVDWMELLADIRTTRHLLDLRYEFAPPRRRAADEATGGVIRVSEMKLQLALLHEGDLLTVLDDLRARAPAYVLIRNCRLTRLTDHDQAAHAAASVDADCTLEWITFPLPGEPS